MKPVRLNAFLLLLGALAVSGCAAVAAGTAGALIADEAIVEDDGQFDPFENTAVGREIYH